MIWGSRQTTVASLESAIETRYVLDLTHRVHAYRLAGVIDDSALHRPPFSAHAQLSERPTLSVLLAGRQRLRLGDTTHWLEAGDAYLIPKGARFGWRLEGDAAGVSFAWDHAEALELRMLRVDVSRLSGAIASLPTDSLAHERAEQAHADILAALTAIAPEIAGVPRSDSARAHQALAAAVDRRLSDLAAEPMQVELQDELGISERTLRRLIAEMFQRYGFVDANWAEARIRRRLTIAVALMSHPKATVAEVAQVVGYRSTQAMARAFSRAGYPPPAQIRAELAELS